MTKFTIYLIIILISVIYNVIQYKKIDKSLILKNRREQDLNWLFLEGIQNFCHIIEEYNPEEKNITNNVVMKQMSFYIGQSYAAVAKTTFYEDNHLLSNVVIEMRDLFTSPGSETILFKNELIDIYKYLKKIQSNPIDIKTTKLLLEILVKLEYKEKSPLKETIL